MSYPSRIYYTEKDKAMRPTSDKFNCTLSGSSTFDPLVANFPTTTNAKKNIGRWFFCYSTVTLFARLRG